MLYLSSTETIPQNEKNKKNKTDFTFARNIEDIMLNKYTAMKNKMHNFYISPEKEVHRDETR